MRPKSSYMSCDLKTFLRRFADLNVSPVPHGHPIIAEIEKAIDLSVEDWKGNCFAIASKIVDRCGVKGTAVYGHWLGPKGKYFNERGRRNLPFVQHGWILLDDGRILDPTRWVFEDKASYIFIGREPNADEEDCANCGHVLDEHAPEGCTSWDADEDDECNCDGFIASPWPYDEGGNKWKAAVARERPIPEIPSSKERKPVFAKVSLNARRLLSELLNDPLVKTKGVSSSQVFYLANLSYGTLGPFVHEVYNALKAHEMEAFVPVDNMLRSQREQEKPSKKGKSR